MLRRHVPQDRGAAPVFTGHYMDQFGTQSGSDMLEAAGATLSRTGARRRGDLTGRLSGETERTKVCGIGTARPIEGGTVGGSHRPGRD